MELASCGSGRHNSRDFGNRTPASLILGCRRLLLHGKAHETFVVVNNHFEGKAAVNALQLKHMLTGRAVPVPDTLLRRYWELGEIAEKGAE